MHRLRKAGDQVNNLYLQHEEDLSFAELEMISINDTIQHLLLMKTEKENEKLLLENAIMHDKSTIDENGMIMNNNNNLDILEEVIEPDDSELKDNNNSHINTIKLTAYEFINTHEKILWCYSNIKKKKTDFFLEFYFTV